MFGWLRYALPSYENEKFLRDIKRRAIEREEDRRIDVLADKIAARLKEPTAQTDVDGGERG